MVGSIFDPNDKIATDLGSKSTTNNIIATGVISATNSDLLKCIVFVCPPVTNNTLRVQLYMSHAYILVITTPTVGPCVSKLAWWRV